MEATLHEVAADLGRLALLYRSQGMAQHAVPLYMTALAIYEKTLGPEHPEVAKDLVNLGNAFCDQDQHAEAVPLYLRALAIDQAAWLGLGLANPNPNHNPNPNPGRAGRRAPRGRHGPEQPGHRLPRAGSA